jgi:hypothetical protein
MIGKATAQKRGNMHLNIVAPPDSCEAGAPRNEIEITAAMIEAGAYELAMFNSEYDSFEGGAERIFLVMMGTVKASQSCD